MCGEDNPIGLKVRPYVRGTNVCIEVNLNPEYGGFEGVAHGGIVCALLDEAMVWAACRASGFMCVTAALETRFLKPTPVQTNLIVVASASKIKTRLYEGKGAVMDSEGTQYSTGTGKFMCMTNSETRRVDSGLRYKGDAPLRLFDYKAGP